VDDVEAAVQEQWAAQQRQAQHDPAQDLADHGGRAEALGDQAEALGHDEDGEELQQQRLHGHGACGARASGHAGATPGSVLRLSHRGSRGPGPVQGKLGTRVRREAASPTVPCAAGRWARAVQRRPV
jgi:hypothetical protein